jgi:hypothetical protein
MNIDELLTKYFEGETTSEEEKRLRAFFAAGQVPQRLAVYKPLFAYFDQEISHRQVQKAASPSRGRKTYLYALTGVAAGILLLLGIRQAVFAPAQPDPCWCSDSYVVINGRCYTDIQKARSLAFEALQEVATPADAYFPGSELFNNEE